MKEFKSKLDNSKQSFLFYEGEIFNLLTFCAVCVYLVIIIDVVYSNIMISFCTSFTIFDFFKNLFENITVNIIELLDSKRYCSITFFTGFVALIKFYKMPSIRKKDLIKAKKLPYIFWSVSCCLFAILIFTKFFIYSICPIISNLSTLFDIIEHIYNIIILILGIKYSILGSQKWNNLYQEFYIYNHHSYYHFYKFTQFYNFYYLIQFIPDKLYIPFLLTYKRNERPPPKRWSFTVLKYRPHLIVKCYTLFFFL